MSTEPNIRAGVENLLFNCIGASDGQSLAIVYEPDNDDYYSPTLAHTVARYAREHGLETTLVGVPFVEDATKLPTQVREAFDVADHTLFLARVGDQVRFGELAGGGTKTVCYALDEASFATGFCSAHYQFFVQLKHLINSALWRAKKITITCASGTSLVGAPGEDPGDDDINDVMIKRFPLTVFRPVPGADFSGTIAMSRWLCPTGSRLYSPDSVLLDGVVLASVKSGRITELSGDPAESRKVSEHYDFVASRYGIDRNIVHSWHAGFHPQNGYVGIATDNLARWSGSAFGNPRYLHFHTCGNYAPGEICISVFDPTISVDGATLWRDGNLEFANTPEVQSLMDGYPGIREMFDSPQRDYGLC